MAPEDPSPRPPSLREQIDAWSREHAADFPPEVTRLFAEKTEELLQSDILSQVRKVGDFSPSFELPDTAGRVVGLDGQLQKGPVILSFYRGTWCPYCNIEFQALLRTMPGFQVRHASVLAISPQVRERHTDPRVDGFLDLADRGNLVAREFGLVYPLGDRIRKVYRQFGIFLEHLHEDESYEVPIPATFIVDRDRRIRYAHASGDITERAEPGELLENLTQLAA